MKRIRWFGADWQVSFRTLASKMRAHSFKQTSVDGFIVDRLRDNTIGGRYIEKVSFQEKVTDPFGDEQIIDRTLYRQLEFNLFQTFPNIEFWDAPRNTSGYVSKLLEFSNFGISVSPLAVNPLKWADAFQVHAKSKVTIVSLQVSGLEIETGIAAKIVVTGDKDVREAVKSVTKNRRYELDKLQLLLFQSGVPVSIQLASTGAAKIDESFVDDFLPALRNSLPQPKALGI